MKKLAILLALLACASVARAGEFYPVVRDAAGAYRVDTAHGPYLSVPKLSPPKTLADWLRLGADEAWAAGFDATIPLNSAVALDGAQCTTTGVYSGLAVPRCTQNDSGVFYVPFGLATSPASAPSFTASFDVANRDTTSGRHICHRFSCAVIGAGQTLTSSPSGLTYGTATSLVDFTNASCAADGQTCTGTTSGSFTCTYNDGTPAACGNGTATECNSHLLFIKVETRATSCTATNVTSADYGVLRLTEAN